MASRNASALRAESGWVDRPQALMTALKERGVGRIDNSGLVSCSLDISKQSASADDAAVGDEGELAQYASNTEVYKNELGDMDEASSPSAPSPPSSSEAN